MDCRLWNNRIRIRLSTSNTGLWFKDGKYTFVLKKLINPRIFKDQLLYKYEVPYNQYQNTSWFISPMAEIESFDHNCINTWLYIADTNAPSLLVYSLRQNTSWRIQDRSFDPDPNYNVYSIGGLGIFTWKLLKKVCKFHRWQYHVGWRNYNGRLKSKMGWTWQKIALPRLVQYPRIMGVC